MPYRANAAVALILAALFAGCAGSGGEGQSLPGGDINVGAGTASIRGSVVDVELQPIPGATVSTSGVEPLLTDVAGAFHIRGLAAGEYTLTATAPDFITAERQISLGEGQEAFVEFTLDQVGSVEPYLEILNFRGYSFCDEAYYAGSSPGEAESPCATLLGQGKKPENQWNISVASSWRFVVSEVTWQAQLGGTSDSMRLVHSKNESCHSGDPCYGLVYANYYARLEGEPGKTDLVNHYDPYEDLRGPPYPNESFPLYVFVNWIGYLREFTGPTCPLWAPIVVGSNYKPGCLGLGISTGIPFDLWVTLFHWSPPADYGACCPATEYSAVPDN